MMNALRLRAETGGEEKVRSSSAAIAWPNPVLQREKIACPQPRADEILIRVAYCGVCGSDFHLAAAHYSGLASLPVTIGHEFSGTVEAHGPGLSDAGKKSFPLGSLVTAEEMLWCGHCDACRAGHLNHCENLEELGFTVDGAQAEYVCVPSRVCWSLEPLRERYGADRALQLGALVEPYAVSYRALFQGAHAGRWAPGARVLVMGAGPIGMAALDLALLGGALRVDILEPETARRALALSLGAHKALAPEGRQTLTCQYDWIVDAAGATAAGLEILETKGAVGATFCLLARTDEPAALRPETLITKNARVVGSQGHSGESAFRKVIDLLGAGRLRAENLVEEVISLEQAEKRLRNQQKCAGKILVRHHGEA